VIQVDDPGYRTLMDKITRDRGFRCASYKDKCLRRRIAVRMRAKGAHTATEYAGVLDTDPREYERLMRSLTINVTKFFRNAETYAAIEKRVIPQLSSSRPEPVRVWSAGCASGEEPYSIAILLHKYAQETKTLDRLSNFDVLGTDIDGEVLGEAERAFYADSSLAETPLSLRDIYFPQVAGLRTMRPEVRKMVRFENNDLLAFNPPIAPVDLILCRNVIIYFEREAQDKLFAEFHRVLTPGGFLVLGKVETLLGEARSLFVPINSRERIFQKGA
jgi:chemotaxis protein methyltransferase CheR